MPALNFTMFVEKVESGEKRQTIRPVRKRPIRVGDTLHLYTGMRTKHARKLGEAVCESVDPVAIFRRGFVQAYPDDGSDLVTAVEESNYYDPYADSFAQADGFDDWPAMRDWFEKTHGLPFHGVLIKWGELKREGAGS